MIYVLLGVCLWPVNSYDCQFVANQLDDYWMNDSYYFATVRDLMLAGF